MHARCCSITRYRGVITGAELMQHFAETHPLSVNSAAPASSPPAAPRAGGPQAQVGPDGRIQVLIRGVCGKPFTYHVFSHSTIQQLKQLYQERDEGILADQLRLTYASNYLENSRTLADCGITYNAMLYARYGLKGD